MILAAGRGSRLNELTQKIPKPLVKVNAKPLLEYHLDALEAAGFSEVAINTSWLAQKIEDYFANQYKGSLQIKLYHEPQALETGGGVLKALDYLAKDEEAFLVINSDVMCDFDYAKIPRTINNGVAHLFLVDNPEQHPKGDFILHDNNSLALKTNAETSDLAKILTFSGISVLTPKIFEHCVMQKFSLGDLYREYVGKGLITGERIEQKWFDVGTLERLKLAEQWQQSQYEK
jgi:MurNAc alpha-1-phosphate uridylyltransferase